MRRAGALLAASGALLAAAATACASRDIVASGVVPGDQPAYCAGPGPVILVAPKPRPGDRAAVCTGAVAVRTFPRALCTCEGYATSTTLTTDSFDSAAGPYAPGGASGDVGVNGELRASAILDIHGALAAAGTAGVGVLSDLHVAHDLDVGGALGTGVTVAAGGDARLAGAVDLAALTVTGTLTIPDGVALAGTISAGATVRAPVSIDPPCACGAADLVDIPGLVAAHADDNQDATIGLTPDRLTDYRGAISLDLPCGIYYLGPVRGDGALTVRVTGRAALLIDGDVTLTSPLTIELATEDAELDLMVSGIVSSDQAIVIGRAGHPARTRVYIGGAGTIDLSGDSRLAGNLYAPRAAIALSATATVFGSLFVRRLDQAAPITIHYDVDVRRADVACPL
ncbi:MAG: hypothetical protein ABIY55_30860 [Kofleriaceae bacterium]